MDGDTGLSLGAMPPPGNVVKDTFDVETHFKYNSI